MTSTREDVLRAKKALYLAYLNLDQETMLALPEKEIDLMYDLSRDAEIQALLEKALHKDKKEVEA